MISSPLLRRAAFVLAALALTSTAAAAKTKHADEPAAEHACEQPCAHVEDCPKVSCECGHDTASGVAICDTEKTHCCFSARDACERFCQVHHQKWTGKFSAEPSASSETAGSPGPAASPSAGDASAEATAPTCSEPCHEAKECPTITCQCAHGTAPNVAACNAKTHCCGEARVVCDHFCGAQKDKWTGKLVDEPPARDGDSLDDPHDLLGPDDDDGGGSDDE